MPLFLLLLSSCYFGGRCDPCVETVEISMFDAAGEPVDTFVGEVGLGSDTVAFSCTDGEGGTSDYACQGNTVVFSTTESVLDLRVEDPEGYSYEGSPESEEMESGNGDCGYCEQYWIRVELEDCGDCG